MFSYISDHIIFGVAGFEHVAYIHKIASSYKCPRICSHRFLNVILHEGHPCPELQNPLFQKVEKNLLPRGEGARQGG